MMTSEGYFEFYLQHQCSRRGRITNVPVRVQTSRNASWYHRRGNLAFLVLKGGVVRM
jgi:hypothetical protein